MPNIIEKHLSKEEMHLPDFHFKEVEELYEHDLTIPAELYEFLLQKDRKLLIEDLQKLLQHAIDEYETFNGKNVTEKNTYFVWHAVFLLKDLVASECLPALLNLIKNEDYIRLYLGDLLTDFAWELFFTLGDQQLRPLIDFTKNLPDDFVIRTEIVEALQQICLQQPERRLEVESYLRELLLYVSTVTIAEDTFIDDLAEKVLTTIGNLGFTRLFALVKELFEEHKLPAIFMLDWDIFERDYISKKFDALSLIREIRTRKDIYTEYLEAQEEGEDEDDDALYNDFKEYLDELDRNDAYEDSLEELENDKGDKNKNYIDYKELHTPFVKKEPDVGRNDPCPCGSGKKYKKCHGKS